MWEINGVDKVIFKSFMEDFALQRPEELKVVIIENAGFHQVEQEELPENIVLINIPPYTPELNPAERIWQLLKQHFKNKLFTTINDLRKWLYDTINEKLTAATVKSITHNKFYNQLLNSLF